MDDHRLTETLLQNHFTATAALIAVILKNMPDDVRTRVFDAVRNGTGKRALDAARNGTGKVELWTRAESNEVELVPADGSEGLWLARTRPSP